MNNIPMEEDFRRMRIFLKIFFATLIFILLMGMTKDLRRNLRDKMEQNTVVKEKPQTILWQTEL
jgi:hypothetical protein